MEYQFDNILQQVNEEIYKKEEEIALLSRARNSNEVTESKRIAKNVKNMLIKTINRNVRLIIKHKKHLQKIISELECKEREMKQEINILKNEIKREF